ncbi:SP-RING-type domain-containing protein [Psidium guajava]|nr:SP-RING-type domain-containing protein [Psidium guajava]
MECFQTQYLQKQQRPSSPKQVTTKRLTPDQVRLLERTFASHKKLDPGRKLQLAAELGVPPRQVAIWYQNRRARWRTQTLELDKGALQLKLDDALAEKRKLEQEVASLRQELDRAREMLDAARGDGGSHSESSRSAVPEVPMSCAFSEDDVNWCDWDDRSNKVLRMEDRDDDDLYAFWM